MTARLAFTLAILVIAVAFVACSDGPGESRPLAAEDDATPTTTATHAGPTETPTATPTPEPTEDPDRDGDGIANGIDACPDEPETSGGWDLDEDGCPDTLDDLLQLAYDEVDLFWELAFEGSSIVYEPPLAYVGYETAIETECGTATLDNAFYCPVDHGIYFDRNFMQRELDTNGDYGPVFIIAHEWGHLAQALLARLGDDRYTIDIELEADCLAGAFTQFAEQRGVLEEGDLDEAVVSLFRVGDPLDLPWYDPQAHGSPGERIDWFVLGYERGLESCLVD